MLEGDWQRSSVLPALGCNVHMAVDQQTRLRVRQGIQADILHVPVYLSTSLGACPRLWEDAWQEINTKPISHAVRQVAANVSHSMAPGQSFWPWSAESLPFTRLLFLPLSFLQWATVMCTEL